VTISKIGLTLLFFFVIGLHSHPQDLTKEEAIRLAVHGENQLSSIIVFNQIDPSDPLGTKCRTPDGNQEFLYYVCGAKKAKDVRNRLTPYYTKEYIDDLFQQFKIHDDNQGVLALSFDSGYHQSSEDSVENVKIQQQGNKAKVEFKLSFVMDDEAPSFDYPIVEFEYVPHQGWKIASNGFLYWDPSNSEPSYFGNWIVEKLVGSTPISTDANETIIGTKVTYSKEEASFGKDTISNPDYKEEVLSEATFIEDYRNKFKDIGITSKSVRTIEITNWSNIGNILMIKDDQTMIFLWNGNYYEMKKEK
jgi:hypothetical protein